MSNTELTHRVYHREETLADGAVHGIALIAALVAGGFLIMRAITDDARQIAALTIYLTTLVAMLVCSAAYNLAPISPLKWRLRNFDYSAIYLLIAGTYTPLLVQLPDERMAMGMAAIIWLGALAGISFRLLYPDRFRGAALASYLVLGWIGVLALPTFMAALPAQTMNFILVGGLLYCMGVPFFLWEKLKYHNVIWHAFVVSAATCHFIAIALLYI